MDKDLIFDHLNSSYKAFVRLSDSNYEIENAPYDLAYTGLSHSVFNYVRLKTLNLNGFEDILKRLKAPFFCYPTTLIDEADFSNLMQQCNLTKVDSLIGLSLDNLQDFPYQPPHEDIQIKLVTSEEDLEILDDICQDAYNHEKNLAKKMFKGLITKNPAESQAHMFLAYWQGQPAGKGLLATCDNYAGLYWGSVLPLFRRRGIATALIRARLEMARTLGYTKAVMQTPASSLPCYQQIGFKPWGSLPFFKRS